MKLILSHLRSPASRHPRCRIYPRISQTRQKNVVAEKRLKASLSPPLFTTAAEVSESVPLIQLPSSSFSRYSSDSSEFDNMEGYDHSKDVDVSVRDSSPNQNGGARNQAAQAYYHGRKAPMLSEQTRVRVCIFRIQNFHAFFANF